MRSTMFIGLEGSRRRLEQVLEKLLRVKGIRVYYVSWPIKCEGGAAGGKAE
jgi:hypothetical protein